MCKLLFVLCVLFGAVLGYCQAYYVSRYSECNLPKQNWYFDNQSLIICCHGHLLNSSLLGNETCNSSPDHVILVSCRAPVNSFAAILGEKNITLPKSLTITGLWIDRSLIRRLIPGLNDLHSLTIITDMTIRIFNSHIENLHSLKSLHLFRVELPWEIFNNGSITELTIQEITLDQRIQCDNLRVLTLGSVDFETSLEKSLIKQSLLKHCSALQNLTLSKVEPEKLPLFLKGLESLKVLRINNCSGLTSLPATFVDYFGANPDIVDLSWNALTDIHQNVFSGLKNLKKLDLSHNKFTEIKFQDILQIKSLNKEIDLRYNPLELIHFEEKEYTLLATQVNEMGVHITLLINSNIDFECHHIWLARAARDFPSFVVSGVCWDEHKSNLSLAPRDKECAETSCHPACYCSRQWPEKEMTLRCKGLTTMPNVANLHTLFARSNQISQLQLENLPDSLKFLDLSNNNLTRVDRTVAEKLFSVKRSVWLAGNPLVYDCENQPFLMTLQDHNTQVVDYNKILCYDEAKTSQPVSNIFLDPHCVGASDTSNFTTVLGVFLSFIIVFAIFIIIYCQFKRSIKEYIFLHSYCSFCISEDEESDYDSDAENPTDGQTNMLHDVFLSFCHKDKDFVLEELLPGLESDPTHPYKVCIHSRDWVGGEFIPKQIALSVDRSRRTLIVLSRKFVKSAWSLLEFRSALMCEIHGRRSRIIVVALDDVVNDPNLDYELRNYVRSNTYICRDDPLFWKKLRRALPRRKMNTTEEIDGSKSSHVRDCISNNESIILSNFEEIELNRVYPNDYTE